MLDKFAKSAHFLFQEIGRTGLVSPITHDDDAFMTRLGKVKRGLSHKIIIVLVSRTVHNHDDPTSAEKKEHSKHA